MFFYDLLNLFIIQFFIFLFLFLLLLSNLYVIKENYKNGFLFQNINIKKKYNKYILIFSRNYLKIIEIVSLKPHITQQFIGTRRNG